MDCAERCRIGVPGPAAVGVHASPGLVVGGGAFDDVPHLVDRGVEFFLPIDELSARRLAERVGGSGSDIAFAVGEAWLVAALRVGGLAGQRAGDVQELVVQIADEPWAWPVVLCMLKYYSRAPAHDQCGHRTPSTAATLPLISSARSEANSSSTSVAITSSPAMAHDTVGWSMWSNPMITLWMRLFFRYMTLAARSDDSALRLPVTGCQSPISSRTRSSRKTNFSGVSPVVRLNRNSSPRCREVSDRSSRSFCESHCFHVAICRWIQRGPGVLNKPLCIRRRASARVKGPSGG